MTPWAIDLGTTNTAIARWNARNQEPELLHLPQLSRAAAEGQSLDVRFSVPSSVWLLPGDDWKTRFGKLSWVESMTFLGQEGRIGQAALDADAGLMRPHFVRGFKRALLTDGRTPLTQAGSRRFTAGQVGRIFLRELLAEASRVTGERPRDVVFTTPVDSFEPYRAWLQQTSKSLGIKRFRTLDEPVAAAIGYGLRLDTPQKVLVLDFGGSTLHAAVVALTEREAEVGRCQVLAKEGLAIGGDLVDAWMVEEYANRLDYELHDDPDEPSRAWWYRIMLEEARRVKEGLYLRETEAFFLTPPRELQRLPGLLRARKNFRPDQSWTRDQLVALLEKRGLYSQLHALLDRVLDQTLRAGTHPDELAEVLMVGGSTLLPEVYPLVEQRFGRSRVRAWQPFDAVVYGACRYAEGRIARADFLTHDYGVLTYRREGQETVPEYQVIVKAGTAYPTPGPVWQKHLTPTCSLGEPERVFKLVICELSQRHSTHQAFTWDAHGRLHASDASSENGPIVVPLNDENPTLGTLDPPHQPFDRAARLDVRFGVSAERWLWATVTDLRNQKTLLNEVPVVRLR